MNRPLIARSKGAAWDAIVSWSNGTSQPGRSLWVGVRPHDRCQSVQRRGDADPVMMPGEADQRLAG
jgi:hypothetical protein